MEEIWKDVEGFEGLYQVSNKGRLKNIGHWVDRIYTKKDGTKVHDRIYIKEVILKLQKKHLRCINKPTYAGYALRKNGKYHNVLIHRLVAKAFIPNPNNYKIINHINGNGWDNRVENLEWCSYQHNDTYSDRLQKSLTTFLNNPKNRRPMTLMDKNYRIIKEYDGINSLLQDYPEFSRNSIYNVINENRLYHGKYRIKYTDCYDDGTEDKITTFKA